MKISLLSDIYICLSLFQTGSSCILAKCYGKYQRQYYELKGTRAYPPGHRQFLIGYIGYQLSGIPK